MSEELKEFSVEELKEYDGRDGRPAYLALDGRVYDVSESRRWKDGKHMNRHQAGGNLTADLADAPHGAEMLEEFPQVGTLKADASSEAPAPAETGDEAPPEKPVGDKIFTAEELAQYDGQDGRPIYVAHDGRVFDVSESKKWKNGRHMNRHQAGGDLTADIAAAPHDPNLLDRFPLVGTLQEDDEIDERVPTILRLALEAFPFLERHPHPMVVHFPIVFMMSTAAFVFLYLTTGVESFETTAFHMMGGAMLFSTVGIATGFLTWWLNYGAKLSALIIIKILGSFLMFGGATVIFIWRILDPQVLHPPWGGNILFILIAFSLFPIVSIVGYCGAELTFPTQGGRKHD